MRQLSVAPGILSGIRLKKTYSLKEVRRDYNNTTGDLSDDFFDFLNAAKDCFHSIESPFATWITFYKKFETSEFLPAKGIVGELRSNCAQHHSPEKPDGQRPIRPSLKDKYKI